MPKDIDSTTYQKVVADMTVDIPPGNEMIVQSNAKGIYLGKHCILTPEAKFVEANNLLIARVLVETSKSILARVLNPGNSNVRIMKGTIIALLGHI